MPKQKNKAAVPTPSSSEKSCFEEDGFWHHQYLAHYGALLVVEHPKAVTADDLIAILSIEKIINITHWALELGPTATNRHLAMTVFLAIDQDPNSHADVDKSSADTTRKFLQRSNRLCDESGISDATLPAPLTWLKQLWELKTCEPSNTYKVTAAHDVRAWFRTNLSVFRELKLYERKASQADLNYLQAQLDPERGNHTKYPLVAGKWKASINLRFLHVMSLEDATRKAFVIKASPFVRPQRQEVWNGMRVAIHGRTQPEKYAGGRPPDPLKPWEMAAVKAIQAYENTRRDYKAVANLVSEKFPSIKKGAYKEVRKLVTRLNHRKDNPIARPTMK